MGFLVEVDSLRVTNPNDFFKTWPLFATRNSHFSHFYLKHMTAAKTLVPEWQKLNGNAINAYASSSAESGKLCCRSSFFLASTTFYNKHINQTNVVMFCKILLYCASYCYSASGQIA